jgi:hypothetical protein
VIDEKQLQSCAAEALAWALKSQERIQVPSVLQQMESVWYDWKAETLEGYREKRGFGMDRCEDMRRRSAPESPRALHDVGEECLLTDGANFNW